MTSATLGHGSTGASFDSDYLDDLLARGVKVVRLIHTDLFGRQRAKQFPLTHLLDLADGVAYSKVSNAEDLFGVPVSELEFPALAKHPDCRAFADIGTAFIPPWEPDSLWVLSRLTEGAHPSALCPRSQLANASEQLFQTLGLTAVAAGEPEFYLFRRDPAGRVPYSSDGVSYTMDRITDPEGKIGRMHRQLIGLNIGVTAANREFSPGQFEINLAHKPALEAADCAFLLKTAVKELAILENLEASFMPKPVDGEEGSSLHVHLSLWQDQVNAFDGGDHLSEIASHAIAGLQAHGDALMAFAAPTVNSYKRLRGSGLSPRTKSWGEDNRYAFVRVPAERGNATRIELRAGDASANPHLLIAAMLHAVRDGIDRRLTPKPRGLPLPSTLRDAICALEADPVLRDGFGDELIAIYAALKRRECDAFDCAVTDWEWDVYRTQV